MFAPPINPDEEKRLLSLARESIEAAVTQGVSPSLARESLSEGLLKRLGAFVTLYQHGELRGCIGRMEYDRPLYLNVFEAAVAAALHDPRFPPVQANELPSLDVEISVLDEPAPIAGPDEFDPNAHGIVLEIGFRHGVFLPKVAREYGWDRTQTLVMLCRKIGEPDDAWTRPEARFKIFHAHSFRAPLKCD